MCKVVFVTLFALAIASPVAIAAAPPPAPATAAAAGAPTLRVRPYDARSAALLLRGLEGSPTMRDIVDRLESLDVITYVEMQPALPRQLGGRLVWLTSAGAYRYVRISLNPALDTEALISVLGHELRHALEVATTPSIVDERSMEAFYRQNGISMRTHARGWDTQAARDVGDVVRREINTRVTTVASNLESVEPFDPAGWHIVYRRARQLFPAR